MHTQKLVQSLLATVVASCGGGDDSTAQNITFTASSTGMITAGLDGVGQALKPLFSPAYAGAGVGAGGPLGNGAIRPASGLNG